jgi:DNA polymerase-3 subunit beta
LRAVTQDVGQAEEELEIEFTGEEFEIGFNAAFLVDGTDSVDGEQVTLKFINPLRPGLVTGQDESFLYLIMPIRLSS